MEKEEGGHLPFLDIEIHRKTDSTRTYPPMKMEQTQCSETSGNYPEESIRHSEHGESSKLRRFTVCPKTLNVNSFTVTCKEWRNVVHK